MCECYKVGGPWIEEDPDCPVHGREAQERERIENQDRENRLDRLNSLRSYIRGANDIDDIRMCMYEIATILEDIQGLSD